MKNLKLSIFHISGRGGLLRQNVSPFHMGYATKFKDGAIHKTSKKTECMVLLGAGYHILRWYVFGKHKF